MSSPLENFTILFFALLFFGQTPTSEPDPTTAMVVRFVAPPYPRAAKDNRIMGKAVSEVSVALDGSVSNVRTIQAHPVFENSVNDALKQWRFRPQIQEYKLEVTVSFEFDDTCEGTDKHPITAETRVSADLPTLVRVITGLKCVETESSAEKMRN